jgi:hypothetical protein
VLRTSIEPSAGVHPFESNGFLQDTTMDEVASGIIVGEPLERRIVDGLWFVVHLWPLHQPNWGFSKTLKRLETKSETVCEKREITLPSHKSQDISPSFELDISDAVAMKSRGRRKSWLLADKGAMTVSWVCDGINSILQNATCWDFKRRVMQQEKFSPQRVTRGYY